MRVMDGFPLKYMAVHHSLQTQTHTQLLRAHFSFTHSLPLSLILSLINLLHIHLCITMLFSIVLLAPQSHIWPWKTLMNAPHTHMHTHTWRASVTVALSHTLISQRRRALPHSIPLSSPSSLSVSLLQTVIIIYYLSLVISSKLIHRLTNKMSKVIIK